MALPSLDHIIPAHITQSVEITTDSMKSWLAANHDDIQNVIQKAREILQERNEELKRSPRAGEKPLSEEDVEYVLSILRGPLVAELEAYSPTTQILNQTREETFSAFKVRKEVRVNLSELSIETLIWYIFQERITMLDKLIRTKAQEKQQKTDQIEAIGDLKTILAGCQPIQGETMRNIPIASSHEDIMKIQLVAKRANFNIDAYLRTNVAAKHHELHLPYEKYQQLNTALTAHTDKVSTSITAQQLSLVETTKQREQSFEFLSHFNKRMHDTRQSIIGNMR